MKQILTSLVALAVLAVAPAFAQRKATIENVREIEYSSAPNFLKLPAGEYLGESVAVATNSKGHIFVYHRSANTRLFEFDQTGKFLKEIGSGYYGFEFAHSVRVDKDDNIWTVDEGTNMITKFSPDGKVLMVLGRRPPAVEDALAYPVGPNVPAQKYIFCRPTDVGWDPQGNIFVSDGYCNNRVVKYDKNGRFLAQAGSEKAGKALGEFDLPHGLQVDGQGNVWVADRTNNRYQILDNNLKPMREITNLGVGWTVCISPGPHQYAFMSNSNPNGNMPGSWDITGEIYKAELDGTVLGKFGHAGKLAPGFQVVHMMDCRNPNEIIAGEIESWRVQKLILQPTSAKAGGASVRKQPETRRIPMKHLMQTLLAAALIAGVPANAQGDAPEIRFDSAANALKLPAGLYLGEVAGVATNSHGDIFVYTRTGHPTISIGTARPFAHGGSRLFEFDPSGKFLREIGKDSYGFMFAAQVRIDPKDNIWVVDQMTNMVIKLDPQGRLLMLLGRKAENVNVPTRPVKSDGAGRPTDIFERPADVAWDAAGNIFVADGLGNARIAKFDKDGKFVKSWGKKGTATGEFANVRSIAVDAQGNVYAADGGNKRIQVFDNDGSFKTAFGNVGNAQALCMTKGPNQVLYVSNSNPPTDIDRDGEIYRMSLDGTMTGKFGRAGKLLKEFGTVNAIDCRNENTLYVGEIGNLRVQKLTLH